MLTGANVAGAAIVTKASNVVRIGSAKPPSVAGDIEYLMQLLTTLRLSRFCGEGASRSANDSVAVPR